MAPREPVGTAGAAAATARVPISDRLFQKGAEAGSFTAEAEATHPATVPVATAEAPPELDEAAESAFLAEARERGEVVTKPKANGDDEQEEASPKALPPLDELVSRIPADVREALEDLFRARFVTVKRFPKKALK